RQSSLDTKGIGRADAVFADNARRAALRLSSQARCMSRSTRTAFLRITSVPERRPQFNGLRDWRFVRGSHWTDILRRSLPPTSSTRQSQPRSDLVRISAQHAGPYRSELCSLGLPLPRPRRAASRRLMKNSRPTGPPWPMNVLRSFGDVDSLATATVYSM